MIDTHAHVYHEQFDTDRSLVIGRAFGAGVDKILMPNISTASVAPMLEAASEYPGKCLPMLGLHPCEVKEDYAEVLQDMEPLLSQHDFVAIGETGLDFHWDTTFAAQQVQALEIQVEWALKYHLPLALHTRKATWETIEVLKKYSGTPLTGVFHCFSGNPDEANTIISMGYYLGIGGVVTFKNAGLSEVLPHVPLEYVLLETDCPYLAPGPFRGKRNEPVFLSFVVKKLAEIYGTEEDIIRKVTTKNAERLFPFPKGY